jgi:hypothetical protein
MKSFSLLLGVGTVLFAACAVYANVSESAKPQTEAAPMHIVLIGASIGKSWDLPTLPQRTKSERFTFEALQVWDYDKSAAVEETLMRPARKFKFTRTYLKGFFEPSPRVPDLVILKECSSYFGGDVQLQQKKELFQRWVEEVRQKKIPVMVTTIAPVTRARADRDGAAKHRAIREFNEWMRVYAQEQRLPLLDLEKALRTDDKERYLRDEFTSGDGSHLNRAAYEVLDRVLIDALSQVNAAASGAKQARAN